MDKPPVFKANKSSPSSFSKTTNPQDSSSKPKEVTHESFRVFQSPPVIKDETKLWDKSPPLISLSMSSSPTLQQRRSFNAFPRPWQPSKNEPSKVDFVPRRFTSDIEKNIEIEDISDDCKVKLGNEKQSPSVSLSTDITRDLSQASNSTFLLGINRKEEPKKIFPRDSTLTKSADQEWHSKDCSSFEDPRPTKFRVSGELPSADSKDLASTPKLSEGERGGSNSSPPLVSEQLCYHREESPNSVLSGVANYSFGDSCDYNREQVTCPLGGNGQSDREAPLFNPSFNHRSNLIPKKYVRKKPDIPGNLFKRRASQDESAARETSLSVKVKTQSLPGSPNPKGKSHFFHHSTTKKKEAKSPEETKVPSCGRTTVNQILATLNFARFRLEELTGNLGGNRKDTVKHNPTQPTNRSFFSQKPPKFVRNDLEKLKKSTEKLKLHPDRFTNPKKSLDIMEAWKGSGNKSKSNNKGILKSKTALSRTQSSPSSTNGVHQYPSSRIRHNSEEGSETKKSENKKRGNVGVNISKTSRDIPFRSASITQSVLRNDPKGERYLTSLRLYPGCKGYEKSNSLPRMKSTPFQTPFSTDSELDLSWNEEKSLKRPLVQNEANIAVPFFSSQSSIHASTISSANQPFITETQGDQATLNSLLSPDMSTTKEMASCLDSNLENQKELTTASSIPPEMAYQISDRASPTYLYPMKPKLKRDKTIEEEEESMDDLLDHSQTLLKDKTLSSEKNRDFPTSLEKTELEPPKPPVKPKPQLLLMSCMKHSLALKENLSVGDQSAMISRLDDQVENENTGLPITEKYESSSLENYSSNSGFNSLRKCMSDPSIKNLICEEPIQLPESSFCHLKQSPTFPPLGTNRLDGPKSRTWHADMMYNLITAAQRKKDCTLLNLQRETYSFDSTPQEYVHNLDIHNSGFPFRRSSLHVFQELQPTDLCDTEEPCSVSEPNTHMLPILNNEQVFSPHEEEATEPILIPQYLEDPVPSTPQEVQSYQPSIALDSSKISKELHDSFSEPDAGSRLSISRNTSPGPYTGDSDSGDKQRSPHIPRRYSKRPLRGPYGEMLEAEMSKSKRSSGQYLGEDMYLKLPDSNNTSPRPSSPASPIALGARGSLGLVSLGETSPGLTLPTSRSLDDSTLPMYYASVTTQSEGFLKPGITVQSSESDHEGLIPPPKSFHQRTASSPSKLFFEAGCTSDDEQDMREYIYESRKQKTHKKEMFTENQSVLVGAPSDTNVGKSHTLPALSMKAEDSSGQLTQKKRDASYYKRKDTRVHIIGELHQTEKNYVENLNFLLTKYLLPLRRPENSNIIEPNLLDDIFFKIPEIHGYHSKFLEELQRRIEPRDQNICVGDLITQMVQDPQITETYTSYVSNWKTAREAASSASQAKPAFKQFLCARAREHTKKRDLKSLLISIVQRFPHYELILKRLLEYTSRDHQDHLLLKEALAEVQKVSASINAVDQEALRLEQQQFILKEISQYTDGSFDNIIQSDREYIQHEQVLFYAGTQGTKERCLFLFSDMLVITSIKRKASGGRKSNSMQLSLFSGLEPYKLRPIYTVPLDDVEIGRSRDDNIKKLIRERESYEEDLQTLQKIAQLIKTLHYAKSGLEEALLDSNSSIKKQLSDRQSTETPLRELELNIMTEEGLQNHVYLFNNSDKRARWEDALTLAKQKLASSADRFPLPEFVTALPIRKTRAGLQFTCASPTLSIYPNNTKDVWVCNSDGYVGQVCVMSVEPEASVDSCNGVCNARIMSIAAVPPPNTGSFSNEDDQDLDASQEGQSEEMETEGPLQPTMWLGTEDGSIHVYNCNDSIRTRKNKFKFQPGSPVHCIIYTENRVLASLANGQLIVYHRNTLGSWNGAEKEVFTLSTAAAPITRMVISAEKIWCSACNDIKILNIQTLQVEHSLNVGNESSRGITCMVSVDNSVWVALSSSSVVKLFNASTFECVQEINVTPAVKKMLSSCDEIIKQHKSACLRITSLLACNDLLWVGTSAGIIITLPLPDLSTGNRKSQRPVNMVGIPHGHTGHVRFLTCIESSLDEETSERTRTSTSEKKNENGSKYLVISGGDGYEDFRNTGNTEVAGREDSTNHLLLWQS